MHRTRMYWTIYIGQWAGGTFSAIFFIFFYGLPLLFKFIHTKQNFADYHIQRMQTSVHILHEGSIGVLHGIDDVFAQHLHLSVDLVQPDIHVAPELVAVSLVLHIQCVEALSHLGIEISI